MATELEDAKIEKIQNSATVYPDGSIQLSETHRVFQDGVLLGSYNYRVAVKDTDPAPQLVTDVIADRGAS